MASKVLTIEISNDLIRLCEVSHSGNKNITVHKAVTIPTPEGTVEDGFLRDVNAVTTSIKMALTDNLLNTKDAIFTVLSTKIATKEAVLPNVKPKKLEELIHINAAEYFPVNNIEDYSLTYSALETITEGKEKTIRVLAMAAPLNLVSPYYDLAKKLGLNVVAVEYLGNSTLQMLKLQIDESPSMVIQIGNDSTIINVMKNKILQFQRTVPYGRSAVLNAIMDVKKISYPVASELLTRGSIVHETFDGEEITESLRYLVNSISRIVDYYIGRNQDSPIEKAYIMGEGAAIIGIEKLFTNELNIDFTKIIELSGVEPDKFFRFNKTELLAYMAPMGACLSPVNFKMETAAKVKKSKTVDTKKYLAIAIVVAAAISVVATAIPVTKYIIYKNQTEDYEKKVKNLEGAKKTYDEYITYKNLSGQVEEFYLSGCGNNDYLYQFIKDLESTLPSDISLKTINSVDGKVTLSGYCRDKATLARTLMQLKGMSYVSDVSTNGGNETISNDGVITVEFTVTCTFKTPVDPMTKIIVEEDSKKNNEKTTKKEAN